MRKAEKIVDTFSPALTYSGKKELILAIKRMAQVASANGFDDILVTKDIYPAITKANASLATAERALYRAIDFCWMNGNNEALSKIIGNGFDLNHGYCTDYKSFAQSTNDPAMQKFKEYCDLENIDTWYLFEENIRILSEKFFLNSMAEDADYDDVRREVKELTRVFERIHVLLREYLARETASRPLVKKPCIEKYLNRNTAAINFNYTATAEAYCKNITYVHGSLAEGDILLGYDYRGTGCLEQFEDMQWDKTICREALAFRRHFLDTKKYKPDSKKYQDLLAGLKAYQHWENTGRGIDDEVEKFIPRYRTVHKFLQRHRNRFLIPKLSYEKIKTLAVLCHGIEADKMFLQAIAEKCTNLETVVIYRYKGEPESSFNPKAEFFKPYCGKIESVEY